jgi:Holliday junction resolvase RusA-like endonuclease
VAVYSCRQQETMADRARWPLLGRFHLRMVVSPPDQRRRDISNLIKVVEDSLTLAGVWSDDEQVSLLEVVRDVIRDGGSVLVEVSEL